MEVLDSYHPISNLPYLSKLIERVVVAQLNDHMSQHNLQEPLQSAYSKFHSTEIAIIYILNNLLCAIDNNDMVFVSLPDCSAAFDLVDHLTLLHRLIHHLGVSDKPLDWFGSYLSENTQCVSINGTISPAHQLSCGVPQGSVLGPRLFTIYTQLLGDIICMHDVNFHLYADDTQLDLACKQDDCPQIQRETLCRFEACNADIRR